MCCLGLSMVAQEQAGQLLPFDFLDFSSWQRGSFGYALPFC